VTFDEALQDRGHRGDGIGKEVMPEGVRVLEAAGRKFGIEFAWRISLELRIPSQARPHDARGRPAEPSLSRRGVLRRLRFPGVPTTSPCGSCWCDAPRLRSYVNLRRCADAGIQSLSPGASRATSISGSCARTRGEYSAVGGRIFEGTERETVTQMTMFTRKGTDRILKYAFDLARSAQEAPHLGDKSNGIAITSPTGRARARDGAQYPDVKTDQYHIDILTAHFVQHPDGSMSWSGRISSATSSRTSGRRAPAHRHRAFGNINPNGNFPRFRAGARLCARHLRQEHRQSHRQICREQ